MIYTTTLADLRANDACIDGYNKLVCALTGQTFDEDAKQRIKCDHADPIPLAYILESNGLDDALWALRAVEKTPAFVRDCRLYALWCARQVQHLMQDPRSIAALDVAERHANGQATDEHLAAAWAAAQDAAGAAAWAAAQDAAGAAAWAAARDAAWAAAWAAAQDAAKDAAWAAQDAAGAAAWAAARDAAWAAAQDAAGAAAWAAARDAARDAAGAAARGAQAEQFKIVFCGGAA